MSSRTSALDYDVQKIAAALELATQHFDSHMRRIDAFRKRRDAGDDAGLLSRLNRAFARAPALPRGVDAALTCMDTSLGYLASIEADCGHQPAAAAADDVLAQQRVAEWHNKSGAVRESLLARVRALPQWQAYQAKAAVRGANADVIITQREVPSALVGGAPLVEDVMLLRLPLGAPAVAPAAIAPRYAAAH